MCYNCGGGYSSAPACAGSSIAQYSALEAAVDEYKPAMRMSEEPSRAEKPGRPEIPVFQARETYNSMVERYTEGMYLSAKTGSTMYFSPAEFLNNIPTEFIGCKDEQQKQFVKELVENAFEAATGKKAPKDIAIRICSAEEIKQIHEANGGAWNPCIRGFSLNRRGFGISEIFVQEDELARLMLTIGHEIGHVLTLPMENAVDEEAKAFAFSMAWMNAVKDNNIGGLYDVISPMPAKNGLHNRAFDFVADLIRKGRKAIDVYLDLIKGEISIRNMVPAY